MNVVAFVGVEADLALDDLDAVATVLGGDDDAVIGASADGQDDHFRARQWRRGEAVVLDQFGGHLFAGQALDLEADVRPGGFGAAQDAAQGQAHIAQGAVDLLADKRWQSGHQ
ncbi:hypothetical protein D3C84_188450 [compost metagenome]